MTMTKVQFLSELENAVIKSIFDHAIERDDWNVQTDTEITYNNDIVGYVKYDLTKEPIYGMKSNDYDVPNDPDEVKLTLNESDVTIYGQTGNVLTNITKSLNDSIFSYFGKQITI